MELETRCGIANVVMDTDRQTREPDSLDNRESNPGGYLENSSSWVVHGTTVCRTLPKHRCCAGAIVAFHLVSLEKASSAD